MKPKVPVAVLGATGTVGQKLVRLLAEHPWFEIAALAASDQSAGKRYGDVVRWRESFPLPDRIAGMMIVRPAPPLPGRIAFSALDADVAKEIEQSFAQCGAFVVTNTRIHRLDADIPLMIPEINADHLGLIERQRAGRGWPGAILANPNCSTAGLVLALAPLHAAFGVDKVFVTTLQAVSGAGYPGVPSLDILGNVIPFIGGEEEKIERETAKILGKLRNGEVQAASMTISAHCNRVATVDGHLETVSVGLGRRATPEEAVAVLRDFRGPERVQGLPSSPTAPIVVDPRPDRPQTRLDLERGNGMSVTVGRVRPCPLLDLRLVLLSHNTIRGAAGAAMQIAELLVAEGHVQ
jgi:aspartate-semialdehyde dehydrogenase